jgi:hypothetical protein
MRSGLLVSVGHGSVHILTDGNNVEISVLVPISTFPIMQVSRTRTVYSHMIRTHNHATVILG